MAISIEAEKAFEKFQYPFMINTLQKMSKEGTYLSIIKAICDKSDIILKGKRLKAVFLVRNKTKITLPTFIQHSFGSPSYGNPEKAMAPHSSTLAWKIPWMAEPGGLQSMG